MPVLDPPPNTSTWYLLRDWLYKLWKSVVGGTFGADVASYSAAIAAMSGSAGDGGSSIVLPPFRAQMVATNTSTFSLPTGNSGNITSWTTVIDTASGFNGTTYTFPSTGYYQINFTARTASITVVEGGVSSSIIVTTQRTYESVTVVSGAGTASPGFGSIGVTAPANKGDTCNVQVFNGFGVATTLGGSSADTFWTITQVG